MNFVTGIVNRAAKDVEHATVQGFSAQEADVAVHRFRILAFKIGRGVEAEIDQTLSQDGADAGNDLERPEWRFFLSGGMEKPPSIEMRITEAGYPVHHRDS